MKKAAVIAIFLLSISAPGQFGQRRFGGGRSSFNNGPTGGTCIVPGYRGGDGTEDLPTPRKIDRNGFVYARLRYHVVPWWREATREIPWHHDYPDGDTMFPTSLERLTLTHTDGESYQIVDVDSKDLFQYPFVYLSEPGYLDLLPADAANLREYLERGGFVLVDDFRGNGSDNSEFENLIRQFKKVYPDRDIVPLDSKHEIFHTFFDIDPKNMLPPYRMWNSGEVQFLGLSDPKGRLEVMVDFNNDMSEYWQALDVGQCSIHEAGLAVQLGINYALYALTH
jgi:Domain of unknown function (DUF4159)